MNSNLRKSARLCIVRKIEAFLFGSIDIDNEITNLL